MTSSPTVEISVDINSSSPQKTLFFPISSAHCTLCDIKVLFDYCRWRTSNVGDLLDREMNAQTCSKVTKETAPLLYYIDNRWWRILCVFLAIWNLYNSSTSIGQLFLVESWAVLVRNVRIDLLPYSPAPSPLALQLIYQGCSVGSVLEFSGTNLSWTFSDPIYADGYVLDFATSTEELSFTIKTSNDGWETNWTLGASIMRWTPAGPRALAQPCYGHAAFDGRPPWPWYLSSGSAPVVIIISFGLLASALFSAVGRPRRAACAAGGGVGLAAALLLLSGVAYFAVGRAAYAFLPLVEGTALAGLVAATAVSEYRFGAACAAAGVVSVVARVFDDCVLFGDAAHLGAAPPVLAVALALWGLALVLDARLRAIALSRRMASQQPAYARAWAALVATEEARSAAERLGVLADGVRRAFPSPGGARQLNRCSPAGIRRQSLSAGTGSSGLRTSLAGFAPGGREHGVPATVVGTADAGCPVVSLDQLYTQALAVAPILLDR